MFAQARPALLAAAMAATAPGPGRHQQVSGNEKKINRLWPQTRIARASPLENRAAAPIWML
jgi:hypothetical protein